MLPGKRQVAAAAILASLAGAGCGTASGIDNEAASDQGPSRIQPVKGSAIPRVVLTAQAAKRIGVATAPVRAGAGRARSGRALLPYAAVVYDAEGHAFAYTTPRPLTYVRAPIRILTTQGAFAVISRGPPAGTPVVTVGAQELLGVEY